MRNSVKTFQKQELMNFFRCTQSNSTQDCRSSSIARDIRATSIGRTRQDFGGHSGYYAQQYANSRTNNSTIAKTETSLEQVIKIH